MRSARRAVRALALAGALAAALLAGCEPPETGAGDPKPDAPAEAPAFTLPDLDGERLSLDSLRGSPVVIDFWATWCAPCVHQIPVLNAFQKDHPDIPVLGVAVDVDGREVVAPFAEEHGIAYRVLLGDEGLARRYGAFGFPTLFVLDGEGRIVHSHVGVIAREELEEALAEVPAS